MKNNTQMIRLIILLIVLFVMLPLSGSAQFYFGQNKVQYSKFDWHEVETEHFRIFFYDDEEELSQIAARIAEDGYDDLKVKFKHEIYKKTPLIIYSSPNHFTQTNVIPSILPESVAGFTEFMKGRVVVPYNGSYSDFAHVIRHELVHVFTYDKLRKVLSYQRLANMTPPPLWFIEGIAEFWSTEWDSEADMVVKDMVLSGRLFSIPNMYQISGTFFMYKLGQSICQFIDEEYGSDKIVLMFENWWKCKSFSEVVKLTLGVSLKELSKKWEYSLKKKYFPEMADMDLTKQEARQLTKDGYALNGVPISIANGKKAGDWIVFKANKRGYTGIYMMPPSGERSKLHTLIKGERSAQFESLHLLKSGIDARDDGRVLFASRSKENDVLYIYDINKNKVTNKYQFSDMSAISSPRFSPNGNYAVFNGTSFEGISDIYLLNLLTSDIKRLTDDIYYDSSPIFSENGKNIIFASDRCPDGDDHALNIYRVSIEGGVPEALTFGNWRDLPSEADKNGIYFSSDREGSFNIYRLNGNGSLSKMTSLLTGVYDPRLSPNKESIVFTGYQDFGYHIYNIELSESEITTIEKPPLGKLFWKPSKISKKYTKAKVRYNTDYSFDIAQSAFSYDPVYGSLGGLQAAISDMLGDQAIYLLLANTAESNDEILTSFNFAATYINRKNRINWGLGIYHFYGEYFNDYDGNFDERQLGGLLYLNYPISRFNRFETTTYLRYSDRDKWMFQFRRKAALLTDYFSFISDNTIWDISGPIEGHRYNFTAGITVRLDETQHYNGIGLADIRQYFRLGKYSAFAMRYFMYSSNGREPQRIYFGGSWSFRGHEWRDFYTRNIVFLSNELRFPLVDNLIVNFPIGAIGFSAIRGALFFDVGYLNDNKFRQIKQKSLVQIIVLLLNNSLEIPPKEEIKFCSRTKCFEIIGCPAEIKSEHNHSS